MINIAVVDDEIIFVDELICKITESCEKLNIKFTIDKFSNGYDLLENYKKYHLIFLDIEMPAIDGITTAKKINELKNEAEIPFIVFITSHDNLVFDALKSFPYSFIRKSDYSEDILECLARVYKNVNSSRPIVTIRSDRKDITINVDDILYLEKQKNYVIYHTNKNQYKVRSDIKKEFEKLAIYGFVRPHIGYIVNNNAIIYIASDHLLLVNNIEVPMNKKYRNEIKQIYFKWLGDKDA